MTRYTRFACLAGVAIASLAFAAQDGILLRRELKEGAVEKYKILTKMNTIVELPNGMGEQEMEMTSTSTYSLTTKKVDAAKGTADIETTASVDDVKATGMMGAAMADQKPKPVTLSGSMDAQGRLKLVAPKDAASMALMMGSSGGSSGMSLFIEFPEKAVKIGDTWEVIVPKGPMSNPVDQKLTAKLIGEKDLNGTPVWVVSIGGKLNTKIDQTMPKDAGGQPNPMAGQKMNVKGGIELSGEGLVSKASGLTLRLETKTKSKQTVTMPSMGMSIDTSSNATMLITKEG